MWLRCRNNMSGHEASIPVGLVESLTDWTPLKGAKPSDTFEDASYNTEPSETDVPSGESATPTTPPADQTGTPENQGE